jgi:hypothetical protein
MLRVCVFMVFRYTLGDGRNVLYDICFQDGQALERSELEFYRE